MKVQIIVAIIVVLSAELRYRFLGATTAVNAAPL